MKTLLSIRQNFGYIWFTDMRALVGRVLHTGTEISLKMSYWICFWLSSFRYRYRVNKRRHYCAERTSLNMFHGHYSTRDWVVHILDKSNFCVNKTLFPVQKAWIRARFDHWAASLGVRSSVHRVLNNTETMLFGVCFALLMCIHTYVECYMTGNTKVPEAQQCTFWTLAMEASLFVDNAWLCF